ncbi:golgin subfamily A member 6-like protein 25 [Planococcus citri]|uniref:golgin subfamily A member 6-like protein 25 n=1 Tax=Planococcus citri TaxID=170843 RepID=UPI0031F73C78
MGNSESRKPTSQSSVAGSTSSWDDRQTTTYEKHKEETTDLSRWSSHTHNNTTSDDNNINNRKHEVDLQVLGQNGGTTPEITTKNHPDSNESNKTNSKLVNRQEIVQSVEQDVEKKLHSDTWQNVNIVAPKENNIIKSMDSELFKYADLQTVNNKSLASNDDFQCKNTTNINCDTYSVEKTSPNDENVNKNSQSGSLPNWPNSMSHGLTTNEAESPATKLSQDKYPRQRHNSNETSQDDTNYHEDGFDTAPSSPTNQAARINQELKITVSPRERFFSSIKPDPENTNEQKQTSSSCLQNDAETPATDNNIQKTDDEPINQSCNGDICTSKIDSNDDEYFEAAEQTDIEQRPLAERVSHSKEAIDWNIKQEIQQLPQHVEDFFNRKKSRRQIPDITITESSDSENESESGEEMESYPCYERTYPSILYDITEVDESFSDASDMDLNDLNSYSETHDKRNFVQQESKFQDQIKTLKCDVETKDTENMQLRGKINDLQREIMNKTWDMDRLHAELASFQTEADCVRKKLLKVEEDLNKYKAKNTELNEELLKKLEYESDFKKVTTLQHEVEILKLKILELQTELENLKKEKQEILNKLMELESEKNEKIKTLQMALDDTLKQKQKIQARFEEEYEKLRTVNSDREQQLLNDFEWKLREVELTCKKKLEDKDKSNEDKIKQVKKQLDDEINELKKQINELEKIKTYEAEVTQLRGLTHEQQRSLRMATRATEQLQSNERTLNEEIERLRSTLEKERTHLATVQGIHSREIAEKDRKHSFKLEQQKNEINSEWEDKVRRETTRLKLEMERAHKEEKRNLIEETKIKTEKQLQENSQIWEKKLLDSKKQMDELEEKLSNKEDTYRKELLRLQTNSDRDMLELRRKLDKMDLVYQEQLEKKQEQHEQEIEMLRESCEKKIQQNEQNWSQQISSTRATLELVKEQLQRESEDQLEALSKKYLLQLEQQYERLIREKEETIEGLKQQYTSEMYSLQNQLNEELKAEKSKEDELQTIINQLKEELSLKTQAEEEVQENVDSLHRTISDLQEKISTYDNLSKEADALLKKREAEHNHAIFEMKERYENEIKLWQSKFSTATTNNKETPTGSKHPEKSSESGSKSEEYNASNIDRQSRSSRRKNRGRNKGQKNQHQQQLNHQFSSSSL